MTDGDLYARGLEARRAFLGDEYVDANLSESDEFMMQFQRAVTELAWGYSWSRPGLDLRTRAVLTLGILAALGRKDELATYAQGAVRNGVTVEEIQEILVHVTAYCGTPTGRHAFVAVHGALKQTGAID